jgi:hypothetical protein
MNNPKPDQALNFVFRLALTILVAVGICSLIWWFNRPRIYDTLGRNIMLAGIVLIVFGAFSLGGRNVSVFKKRSMTGYQRRQSVNQRRRFLDGFDSNTLVILDLFGAGLLCLFIGNLIILGL